MPTWLNALRLAVLGIGIPTLIYWAVREQAIDWSDGWTLSLLAGIALAQAAFAIYALRFRTVMHMAGIELAYVDALRIAFMSFFYQFFVPLSVGGDVSKFVTLRMRAHGAVPVAGGIVFDHFIGLGTLALLTATLFVWRRPLAVDATLWLAAALMLTLMLGVGFAALRYHRREAVALDALPGLIARHRLGALAAFALSLTMQCVFALAVFVGSRQWGIEIAYLDLLFVQAIALIFQAIPLNLGGVGATEIAGTGLYVALGLPLPAAVLLVSLLYVYRLVSAVIGGVWDLAARR